VAETARGHGGSSWRRGGERRGASVLQLWYAGKDAGEDGQPVAVAVGMKPSAPLMWVPPSVSSREYSGLEVYLVDGLFPAAIVG
jgi:hypothetical protein